ncbi:ankyrin repeat domain-containing protein [Flavobacterium sp. TAB 87]|uniref:ankyrin repeat domain-containing protein n=1 Tax=Flavobacterium sp. TAB 87 TaxID=1729581 RepID=UPI00076C31E6|nr:ankyrin repeat domain-containing protein [Flavobacterium sp. TAB 87]KVV13820.1 ankyrin repeat protein [Flavobacterium sp. TAB 87]
MKTIANYLVVLSLACLLWQCKSENKEDNKEEVKAEIAFEIASDQMIDAIVKDNLKKVTLYLDQGESVDGRGKGYWRGGRQKGANDKSDQDWTLLMIAVYNNNADIVQLLLDRKAAVNLVNAAEHSALFIACANRSEEMALLLLKNNADVKNSGSDISGMSALQWALAYEWNEVALKMIRLGANVNSSSSETGHTVLLEAMSGDSIHDEVVHLIIDSGAAVNKVNSKYKTTPLMLACQRNDIVSVKKIIAQKVDVNVEDENGSTALCYASRNDADDLIVLKFLVANGANVNIKNSYGRNALIEAVSSKSIKKAKYLIDKGAEINRKSDGFGGVNAIGDAVSNGDLEMVKLLIENGADVTSESSNGETVLLRAIVSEGSSEPIIRLLIANNADVNSANNDKHTPLMKAAQYNMYSVCKLLLQAGAVKEGKDFFGKTAKDYAEETASRTGDNAILSLLNN